MNNKLYTTDISALSDAVEAHMRDVRRDSESFVCGFRVVRGMISTRYIVVTSERLFHIKSGLIDTRSRTTAISDVLAMIVYYDEMGTPNLQITLEEDQQEYQLNQYAEPIAEHLSESLSAVIVSELDTPVDNLSEQEINGQVSIHLAEKATETARRASADGDMSQSATYYQVAIDAYENADKYPSDQADRDIKKRIQTLSEERSRVDTLRQSRSRLRTLLQKAEQNRYTAMNAQIEGQYTHARTRYRQAKQSYESAITLIKEHEQELLDMPIQIQIETSQPVSEELDDVVKQYREPLSVLTDENTEPIAALQSISHETMQSNQLVDEHTQNELIALKQWPDANTRTFTGLAAIEQQLNRTKSGYQAVQ